MSDNDKMNKMLDYQTQYMEQSKQMVDEWESELNEEKLKIKSDYEPETELFEHEQ